MRTLKACAWSLVLGALFIPALVVSVLMLPWIPLVGRAAEFVGRLGAQWMGVEIPPRRAGRWFDWQQFYHLIVQLLLSAACFAAWTALGFTAGVLVIAPFVPKTEFSFGEWSTTNRPLIFFTCWLTASLLVALLVGLNRLLVLASTSLTRRALSPSAEELAASRATLIDAFSGERRRIERELHDGPQQYLTALKLNLAAAKLQAPPEAQSALADAEHNASLALASLRATVRGIAPQVLFDAGLIPALDELLAHSGLETELHVEGIERSVDETTALLAYHAVAEALTNASKHGAATQATVIVAFGDTLRLGIVDNGTGPNPSPGSGPGDDLGPTAKEPAETGTGIAGLRERAAALGGTVSFAAAHDAAAGERGGRLQVELPLKEAE